MNSFQTSSNTSAPVSKMNQPICIQFANISIYIIYIYIAIPPRIFEMLQSHKDICRRYVRTCKEINIAFLAYEAQVQLA